MILKHIVMCGQIMPSLTEICKAIETGGGGLTCLSVSSVDVQRRYEIIIMYLAKGMGVYSPRNIKKGQTYYLGASVSEPHI